MRRLRFLFLVASAVLTLPVLCGMGLGADPVPGEAPQKKEAAVPKINLSPEAEVKLKAFLDKASEQKSGLWDLRMKKEMDDIATVTGMGEDGRKALEPAAKQAIEVSLNPWRAKLDELVRKQFALQPEQVLMMLDQMLAQAAAPAQIDWTGDITQPYQQDAWTKALQQTLTSAQLTAWGQEQADRKQAIEKEIGDSLKQGSDRIHEQQMQDMIGECKEIELVVGLPQDRADKLEALAKSVVDQTTEMWRKGAEKMLLVMDEEQRQQFTRNGNIFISAEENETPRQQAAWKEGVASLLTADESARLHNAREAHQAKRAHVMGEIMIMLVDEKVAFTASQRQQLQPIAERLMKEVSPQMFPDAGGNAFAAYPPAFFYAVAAKATDAELKSILDDAQRKRWQHLSDPADATASVPPSDDKSKPEELSDPEDVEKLISSFLYTKAESEQKRLLEANLLKAEDITRVTGLSGDAADRLQVAARGATEENLTTWRWFMDQQIRSQLQDATPQNVQQRLASLQEVFFQRNFGMMNRQGPGVWEETVSTVLTPAQRDAWNKETFARKAFRDQVITSWVMAEFDRKCDLTEDQWNKLEPVVAGVVRDYSPEFTQVFGQMNAVSWFMGGYALLPLAGVPDTDLKTILTKDQLARWDGSPEFTNATNLWTMIQQVHTQRIRVIK